MVTTYVPLFGQRLGHLAPMAAGFLSAALAVGWTAQRNHQRFADQPARDRSSDRGRAAGDGVGSGPGWSHATPQRLRGHRRSVGAGVVDCRDRHRHSVAAPDGACDDSVDPAESRVAAAAINIVQLVSAAFGAGLAGVVVNAAPGGPGQQARWLYADSTGSGRRQRSRLVPGDPRRPRIALTRRPHGPKTASSRRDHRGQGELPRGDGRRRPETAEASGAGPFTV